MLAAVIEGPGAVVVRDAAPPAAAGRVQLAPLVTGRFPLGEVRAALTASGRPEHLKIGLDVAGP